MIVVGDSSVLIALSRIGQLRLLEQLYAQVAVPTAVWIEVFGAGITAAPPWIVQHRVEPEWLRAVPGRLDAGEHEAIALACHLKATLLLMDERRGRAIAIGLGVNVSGIVGVLLAAKRHGHIPAISPCLHQLRTNQFWLSERLIRLAQELAGEVPSS